MKRSRSLIGALLMLAPVAAHADAWVVAEAPATFAMSDAQQGVFRAGVMPAIGVYASSPRAALGLRMRAGVLRNGPAPADPYRDPGTGGLVSGGVALRIPLPAGLWVEGVAGGGFTGDDLAPVVEGGVGMLVRAGAFDVGPSVRVLHVIARDEMATFGSATLAVVGIDVRFGSDRPRVPRAPRERVVVSAPVARVEAPIVIEPDRDAPVVDRDASCAASIEGCLFADGLSVEDDRIILEERVLFDVDRARVKSQGREVIALIAREWQRHPEWHRITIEGHADVRGPDAYNDWLSEQRAQRVLDVLAHHGFAADRMSAVGFGRSRPREPGATAAAHQRNRRVEFVIERGVSQ